MGSPPIGYTPCENCHGRGKTDAGASCSICQGTGLVPVKRGIERRRTPRYRTNLPVMVRNREEGAIEGLGTVISEGGLCLTLPQPISVGNVIELQFDIPTHPTALRVWAVVRNLMALQHGMEFVSLTDGERLSLRQYCNGLALQSAS
ncbi:MAG: PilZ domain-containing protein [Terriglobales bacterium]